MSDICGTARDLPMTLSEMTRRSLSLSSSIAALEMALGNSGSGLSLLVLGELETECSSPAVESLCFFLPPLTRRRCSFFFFDLASGDVTRPTTSCLEAGGVSRDFANLARTGFGEAASKASFKSSGSFSFGGVIVCLTVFRWPSPMIATPAITKVTRTPMTQKIQLLPALSLRLKP